MPHEPTLKALDLKNEGNAFFKKGDWNSAIAKYTKAIQADPKYHVPYSNRSQAYFKLGYYKEAAEDGKQCCVVNPEFAKGYHRAANALTKLGDWKGAMAVLEDAYRKGFRTESNLADLDDIVRPKFEEMKDKERKGAKGAMRWKLEGNDAFGASNYDKAIECYSKGISQAGSSEKNVKISCFLNRAMCWQQMAGWSKMIEDCTTVLEMEPNEDQKAKALFRRSLAFENREKFRLALSDIREILRNPKYAGWSAANMAQNRLNRSVRTLKARGVKI